MIIENCEQGTPEWHRLRTAKPSASQFKNIVTSDGKRSTMRAKYLYQLAGERITGTREESYQNGAMQRGTKMEPEARAMFSMVTGFDVEEVGCCVHDSGLYLCSPDGLIGDMGVEIKCPSMAVHVSYLLGNKVPADYYQQVHGSMLVTGFNQWFFVSYYPGLKPLIHLEKRDDVFCKKLEEELNKFCKELDEIAEKIR